MDITTRQGSTGMGYRALALLIVGLGAAAALAAVTGGVVSPVLGLMYVPLVLAGFQPRRIVAACVVAACLLYVVLVRAGSRPGTGSLGELAAQLALFCLVPLVTALVVGRIRGDQRRLGHAASEARTALDIQHMISTAYDIEVTLDLVILKQRDLMPSRSCAVLLADHDYLTVRSSIGLPEAGKPMRFNIHDDDHGWRPADGRPLVLADTASSESIFTMLDPAARSVMVVPLQSVERLVGLLYFGAAGVDGFGPEDVDRAETFANGVVFPIQRALLEEELRRLAFTDAQTALFNHRHFQAQLDEEVRRAQRYGRPVSIIMMDIDDFKSFNDAYGHPAGDRLLQMLSHELSANLRTVDIAARYGGEEFVVICPETTADQATVLADRLRTRIAECPLPLEGGQQTAVTVSMGVAAYPDHAGTKSTLVDAADKALYRAKRSGKNRVVTAG